MCAELGGELMRRMLLSESEDKMELIYELQGEYYFKLSGLDLCEAKIELINVTLNGYVGVGINSTVGNSDIKAWPTIGHIVERLSFHVKINEGTLFYTVIFNGELTKSGSYACEKITSIELWGPNVTVSEETRVNVYGK